MNIVIGILSVICIYFILVILYDGNRFVKKEYIVVNEKIKKDMTYVMLSDLHNKEYGKNNYKLLKAIRNIKPDAILIGGDMLVAKPGRDYEVAASFVERLSKEFSVYYGIGNHEYRMKLYPEDYGNSWDDYFTRLQKQGVTLLVNTHVDIEGANVRLIGSQIDKAYYKRLSKLDMSQAYLESILGKKEDEMFQILLAHNPDYFEAYARWGADLTLSGHVHGGIINFPLLGGMISPTLHLFPRYTGGLYEIDKKQMILSRGLGTHTIPVRVWNPGELIVIQLRKK